MQKLLIYILLLLNILMIGNSHGYSCEQNDVHSSGISKLLTVDSQDSQPASQENDKTTAGHHCCPVCHAHVVMIFMQNDVASAIISVKKDLVAYTYNNLRSSYLNVSPFRPPIA